MKITFSRLITLALLLLAAEATHADSSSEHELKAAYLYHIINFVVWPDDDFPKENGNIEICLIADDDFDQILKTIENKPIRNRHIRVRQLSGKPLPSSCNMLFIHKIQEMDLQGIFATANKHNILTIGDSPRFAEMGGMIGFVIYKDRVRLEVNLATIQNTELKVSAKLLEIALQVIGRNGEYK